jgi:tetratricopeptide (TPR) repeat protein
MKKKLLLYLCFCLVNCIAFTQQPGEGMRLFDKEMYNSAAKAFETTVSANPSDLVSWNALLRTYFINGNIQQAEALPSRIPAASQALPMFHVIKGSVALQKTDSITAQQEFIQALGDARKKDPAIQLAIAQAHIDADKGNLPYAISLLEEASKRDGRNPAIYMAWGDAWRKLFNGSEAVRYYSKAIELDGKNPLPYFKIGKIYQTQNNTEIFNEYYAKALAADPSFAPVYYQQYYAAYFKDVNKALEPLQKYIGLTEPGIKNSYLLADLYYILKKHKEAIAEADKIMAAEKDSVKLRLYKLLAYSHQAINNSGVAEQYLARYFAIAPDSTIAADDVSLMATLLEKRGADSLALDWHTKAYRIEKDTARKSDLARKLIAFNKAKKLYAQQAYWYEQLNGLGASLNNVDIFNWGVADYNAQLYVAADSVFALYERKYPDQTFGYYWRARSNAAIDTAMEMGLAIPHYEHLVEVAEKDTANANNRKWLIQAYGYIAAYKVNTEKAYQEALGYYDKVLTLDPGNDDAEKYKGILSKLIDQQPEEQDKKTESTGRADKDKNLPPGN